MKRRALAVAVICLLFAEAAENAAAGTKTNAPIPVTIAVDGVAQPRNLPVLLAERLHYFDDAGLEVRLIDAPGDPSPDQLIADGRADGAVAFYHHTFMAQADRGLIAQSVVLLGATPQLKLIVANRASNPIRSVADLRGRRVFVGGLNSGKTTAMAWLTARAGMKYSDVQSLRPTTPNEMAGALRDGSADAVIAHEPDAAFYVASGAGHVLADLSSVEGTRANLGTIYPSTALYLPRSFVRAHPEAVRRLVAALLRSLAFIRTHDAATIANLLSPSAAAEDRDKLTATITEDRRAFLTDGRMVAGAARRQLTTMRSISPRYGKVNLTSSFTNFFVDHASRGADR